MSPAALWTGKKGRGERVNGSAGKSPHLKLEGFSGPLDQLLFLVRAQKLDLAKLSLRDFLKQLTGALRREAPINQKAEWVGMVLRDNLGERARQSG
jgi:segregation and condensation protein A